MLTRRWCKNLFSCYSLDSAWVGLSKVFLFCITFLILTFLKLSSQIERRLCLKVMDIDPHWKWDATTWAISTMRFICQATWTSASRRAKSPPLHGVKPGRYWLIPPWPVFIFRFCMFSPCLCIFQPSSSSHQQKTCIMDSECNWHSF